MRTTAADFAQLVAAKNASNGIFRRFAARAIGRNQIRSHDENGPNDVKRDRTTWNSARN